MNSWRENSPIGPNASLRRNLKKVAVFINYRSNHHTTPESRVGAVVNRHLAVALGQEAVFWASKSLQPGMDFAQAIEYAIKKARLMVVIIGPEWSASFAAKKETVDWTAREIHLAQSKKKMHIVPLLLPGVPRLSEKEVPEGIDASIARQQSLRIEKEGDLHIGAACLEIIDVLYDNDGALPSLGRIRAEERLLDMHFRALLAANGEPL